MKHEDVPVEKIKIGSRFRQDDGDLEPLARNIEQMGLLQPIGLDTYYNLIFGARRLRACSINLKWTHIPCVILSIESVLAGEYAENVFRKAFTASELAAIGKAIEEDLGNRKPGPKPKSSAIAEQLTGNTVDIAAKRAGFRSAETYERAKTVVAKGAPEVVAAMDTKDISISAAAAIASQPRPEQKRIVELPKEQRAEVVRQIRDTKAEREANERRALDLRLYRGIYDAVKEIANFQPDAKETWAGLQRVSAYDFSEFLRPAIRCLIRIDKEHPNVEKNPQAIDR